MPASPRSSLPPLRKLITLFLLITSFFACNLAFAQDCLSSISITLKDINTGGYHVGQTVTLRSKADGKTYTAISDNAGLAVLKVPCSVVYEITVSNHTETKEMSAPSSASGRAMRTLTYPADMIAAQKLFEASPEEKAAIDATADAFPAVTLLKSPVMAQPQPADHFRKITLELKDVDGKPLAGEVATFIGEKRKKKVEGTTGPNGILIIYLPKGDTYLLDFKHNPGYAKEECEYAKGSAESLLRLSYLGTREIERRKAEEARRIAEEEKRLKEEEARFAAECKKLGITIEEGLKRKAESYSRSYGNFNDTVIRAVLNRNKWSEKLIVCDLTGSMIPYASQLSAWYQLNYAKEKNLQFVFFNDGDNKSDRDKVIGNTGGIYYEPVNSMEALSKFIGRVGAAGNGGDCPENNMEALIKGVKMTKPYKELVMIVDNYAPVKDIELLNQFNRPVHIIVCGASSGQSIHEDYLNIARHTKGSIHTMTEDLTRLATLNEGQEITIQKITYRVMGGKLVRTSKT